MKGVCVYVRAKVRDVGWLLLIAISDGYGTIIGDETT